MMKKNTKKFWTGIFLSILFIGPIQAQNLRQGFVVDDFSPQAVTANPSILSFQYPNLVTSYSMYHLGFVSSNSQFAQIYIGISQPFFFKNLGIGAYYSGFQSPLFYKRHIGAVLSYRLFHKISIGTSLILRQMGYSLDPVWLDDPSDPVFKTRTSRTTPTFDAGIAFNLNEHVFLTAGVRDINEPPLSLNDQSFRARKGIFAGMALRYNLLRLLAEFEKKNDQFRYQIALEMSTPYGTFFRFGYSPNLSTPNLDILFPIFKGLRLSYSYNLPITKAGQNVLKGSHRFAIIWDFRKLKGLPPPPLFRIDDVILPVSAQLNETGGSMLAIPAQTSVSLFEREIIRDFDQTVTQEIIANLTPADIAEGDVRMELRPAYFEIDSLQLPKMRIEKMGKATSPEYDRTFQILSQKIQSDTSLNVYLVAASPFVYRAAQVKKQYLAPRRKDVKNIQLVKPVFSSIQDSLRFFEKLGRKNIRRIERYVKANPDTLWFEIFDGRTTSKRQNWELIITDLMEKPIRRIVGISGLARLYWNLLDDNGNLIRPGIYKYFLQWKNSEGKIVTSPPQKLYVRKKKRSLHVLVTKDPKKIEKIPSGEVRVFFRK
jgi:hypothetical protein